jgi:hypothetical protein
LGSAHPDEPELALTTGYRILLELGKNCLIMNLRIVGIRVFLYLLHRYLQPCAGTFFSASALVATGD